MKQSEAAKIVERRNGMRFGPSAYAQRMHGQRNAPAQPKQPSMVWGYVGAITLGVMLWAIYIMVAAYGL